MALLVPGPIRIVTLKSDGTKDKTYILPPPDRGDGLQLEFIAKEHAVELVDGSERCRRLGFLPQLTVKWGAYDDRAGEGYTIGTADGNRPSAADLLGILASPPGTLWVTPTLSDDDMPGFLVERVTFPSLALAGIYSAGMRVVFRGRTIQAAPTLEDFPT